MTSEPIVGRRRAMLRISLAAFFSGMGALVAETLWGRALSLITGSTTTATAITFASFLVGLAAGSYVMGLKTERFRNPKFVYALCEFAIAGASITIGLLLFWFRTIPLPVEYPLAIFVGTTLITFIPTALMGATLPLMVSIARVDGLPNSSLGTLYASNVLGAAFGTLLAGFVWIPHLGFVATVVLGGILNVGAGFFFLPVCKPVTTARDDERTTELSNDLSPNERVKFQGVISRFELLAVVFLSGATVLGLEVSWFRVASFFLGNRTYAFSALLTFVLIGLAIGASLTNRLMALGRKSPRTLLSALLLGAAMISSVCLFLSTVWIDHAWMESQLPGANLGPVVIIIYRLFFTALLVLPGMVVLGIVFPAIILMAHPQNNNIAPSVGRFYLANTVGAVVGSLITSLVGFVYLGVLRTMMFWFVFLVVSSVILALMQQMQSRNSKPTRWVLVGATFFFLFGTFVVPQTLNRGFSNQVQERFRSEDENAIVSVVDSKPSWFHGDGYLRAVFTNRQPAMFFANMPETRVCQHLQAHAGMAYVKSPTRALNIGVGLGITAGALGLYSEVETDAVELLPGMIQAAQRGLFPTNMAYTSNPKINISIDDGRNFLLHTDKKYDLISINLTEPSLPGSVYLYTKDFYTIAQKHLSPQGVVVQHVHGHDKGAIVASLQSVFHEVRIFPCYSVVFSGSGSPSFSDLPKLVVERPTEDPPILTFVAVAGEALPTTPTQIIGDHIRRSPELKKELSQIDGLESLLVGKDFFSSDEWIRKLVPAFTAEHLKSAAIITDNNAHLEFVAAGLDEWYMSQL